MNSEPEKRDKKVVSEKLFFKSFALVYKRNENNLHRTKELLFLF